MAGEVQMSLDSRAFLRGLNEALVEFNHDAAEIVETIGDVVADKARALAPVSQDPRAEPGKLKASISSEPGVTEHGPYVDVGVHDPGAYYSLFVEYGTYKMAAEPFMRPALSLARALLRGQGVKVGLTGPRGRAMAHRARVRNKVRKAYQSGQISESEARGLSKQISSKLRYRRRRG